MNATCTVCGHRFDHSIEGIDWRNEKFLCWDCNDAGYDITRRGDITKHGRVIDLVFGEKTLHNAKPGTLTSEFAVAPAAATFKFGCAWATIATVLVGLFLWALVALGMVGIL